MKKNYVDITIVLDESGSMESIKQDTIGSFNSFIEEQKKISGELKLTLITFNQEHKFVFKGKDIQEVKSIDKEYVPSGTTALFDAIGIAISENGKRFDSMTEDEKPEKVLILTITDGAENSSKEYTLDKIKEMVKHQIEKYKWDFSFVGANIDSFSVGSGMGFAQSATMNYNANSRGMRNMFKSVTTSTTKYRNSDADFSLTPEEEPTI